MLASLAPLRKANACSIAIVGGGASGALMTAHLLKCAGDAVRVTLIEPREQIGRGLAYATENDSHRLNVRASNMSAFPDDPDHFWRWLRANGHGGEDRFCFVPRLVYGRYLGGLVEDRLADAESRARALASRGCHRSERARRLPRPPPLRLRNRGLRYGGSVLRTRSLRDARCAIRESMGGPACVEHRPGFDDPDSGHWIDNGRRRDCAERVRPSWTHCRPLSARSSPASPSPRRSRTNRANGIAVACEARFSSALASRESAR